MLWQQVKRTQTKCNFAMVFKPKVHLFITLSYSKQNNESAPLGIGNMQKLGLKGNISYTVFVNVMIFVYAAFPPFLSNKQMFFP